MIESHPLPRLILIIITVIVAVLPLAAHFLGFAAVFLVVQHLLNEALKGLKGRYARLRRVHVDSPGQQLSVPHKQSGQLSMTMEAFLLEASGSGRGDITGMGTETEGEECELPPTGCTPEEQAAQNKSLSEIHNNMCSLAGSGQAAYPITVYLVQLCDGSTAYIAGAENLKLLAGDYNILDELVLTSPEMALEVVITKKRPLFAMRFGHQENGNIDELAWKITNRSEKIYYPSYDQLDRLTGADYGFTRVQSITPQVGAPYLDMQVVMSNTYQVPKIGYDGIGNIMELVRMGQRPVTQICFKPGLIDDLGYTYDTQSGHLLSVRDGAPSGFKNYGFKDGGSAP